MLPEFFHFFNLDFQHAYPYKPSVLCVSFIYVSSVKDNEQRLLFAISRQVIDIMAFPPGGKLRPLLFFSLASLFCLLSIITSAVASAIDPILKGCQSKEESTIVAQAWREAADLASAHFEWYVFYVVACPIHEQLFYLNN